MRRLRAAIGDAVFACGWTAEQQVEAVIGMLEQAGAGVEP